jgi:hypothetical protein
MPSTLVQIRDLIKANTGIKEDSDFTNVLLNRWINDAQRNIQLKLFHLGFREFKSSDSLTLSSGTLGDKSVKTSPLSTDCPNRMGVPNWLLYIDCSNSGGGASDKGLAYPISDRVFLEHLRNTFLSPTSSEPLCTIIDDKIYIAPSAIDTATAHYYKETTDMASDSASVDLPESFVHFLARLVEMRVEDRKGKLQGKESKMRELDKDLSDALQSMQFQKVENLIEPQKLQ